MADRLVIANGIVVTMNDAREVHHGGTVVVEGDRVVAVHPRGPEADAARDGASRVIDATDKAVLPGLVDLHYHTALGKGYSDHLPLLEYLETCWYPIIRALDHEAAYWAALASYSESLRCGVTTVNDMYRRLDALAPAAERIGIRAVLSNDVATDEHRLDTLADNERAYRRWHGRANGRIEVYVGIEWLPLASPELLRDARGLADDLGTGIHVHLNESLGEVRTVLEQFGRRPTELAFDTGLLGPDCIAAHCVWLNDAEIALMRETGTRISHNPVSNAKLGNGIARVPEMLAAGLTVGLGHDAAECNNSRDLFEVMKYASLIHRANRVDAGLFQAPDILAMATRNGADALGHPTGRIEVGRKADLALVGLRNQMFTPLEPGNADHLYSHLVFAANGSSVDTTIVDGVVVLDEGVFTTIDEDEVLAKANEAFLRVLDRIRA
ncbi:5-methylthioadenosine/S-adenosylhomocysteine deaminase [Saccharothrix saharensis]|uniref:5-methylthioadenosine/S-adenosylhomocysteine deaminase n=1 Tax=Saccharothrix saharensis TaxID=571190 RepID=A0A543JQU7_9PSEU|nr:amidohydrolase [Saccharothrix saharensis]TQM85216.1 5-methylthioadenosine/S-adenosylhomocysteine deaminase [Saccharothrix saharensis]